MKIAPISKAVDVVTLKPNKGRTMRLSITANIYPATTLIEDSVADIHFVCLTIYSSKSCLKSGDRLSESGSFLAFNA